MEEKEKKVREILAKFDQEHLLQKYDEMSVERKNQLLDQILRINFEQIQNLYKKTKEKPKFENDRIEPIAFVDKEKLDNNEKEHVQKMGEEIIQAGKLGYITMAGGQRNKVRPQGTKRQFCIME